MTEITTPRQAPVPEQPATGALRTLLPRIFSRAQPAGSVDRLIKTAKLHHPKSDISIIERAYVAAELAHRGSFFRGGIRSVCHLYQILSSDTI